MRGCVLEYRNSRYLPHHAPPDSEFFPRLLSADFTGWVDFATSSGREKIGYECVDVYVSFAFNLWYRPIKALIVCSRGVNKFTRSLWKMCCGKMIRLLLLYIELGWIIPSARKTWIKHLPMEIAMLRFAPFQRLARGDCQVWSSFPCTNWWTLSRTVIGTALIRLETYLSDSNDSKPSQIVPKNRLK